ncbi:MAG: UDP-glucose/GDP-mannose dehydrogenase family protein [Deltaproteobacteria bacterium]
MNVCVIGTGYVGLVTGACFADFGVTVTCVDKDEEKIKALGRGEIPIYEPGLKEVVERNIREKRLSFSIDSAEAVRKSLVVFIAVGTPPRGDGSTELKYIKEVSGVIAKNLNGYKVIVTKSTVPVGTGKLIEEIIRDEVKDHRLFDVASNPEFLREGSAVEDFMRPDKVVIGARSEQAVAILKDLYSPLYLLETPIVVTDVETSELIKYATNAFLATKISFINEIANICELSGADVHVVAKTMGLDKRIGSKFLHPGPGYGGSCLPKDTSAIVNVAKGLGYDFKIVSAVIEVNRAQREFSLQKIAHAASGLKGKTFAVLGLTFKPNTDDVRESPAIDIVNGIVKGGGKVRAYDPVGMANAKGVLSQDVVYCASSYDAAKGADCLVVVTEWNEFRKLDMETIKGCLKNPVVVDLRNVYEPEEMKRLGFGYVGVGRRRAGV